MDTQEYQTDMWEILKDILYSTYIFITLETKEQKLRP